MADCLLCERSLTDAIEVATVARHGHASRRVTCVVCGLVQVSPPPTREALRDYYASHDYRSEHGPVPITISYGDGRSRTVDPRDADYSSALDRMGEWRAQWATEQAGLVPGMRVLEVGSGDGRTLAALAARGLTVTGIEPDVSEAQASVARLPEGSRVHASDLDGALDLLAPPYDAIAMFHVLEHFHDPLSVLRKLKPLLTPRGALVIEVPDVLAPSLPLTYHWQHVHLVDYSRHTLIASLVRAGMEPVWVDTASQLRAVARPESRPGRYELPHGGWWVAGYLAAAGAMSEGRAA